VSDSAPPTSGHLAEFSKSANSWSLVDGGAPTSGTVTSIATTSPLTGGPITASGTIACATCVTSASSLSSNNLMTGAGSQGAQTVNLTGYVFANGSSAPTASSTIPIGSVGSAGLSGTSPITVASSGAIACPTCNTSSATVTSFSAPSGSWPSWLVPTVTNSTSTPSLAVASSMTLANVASGASPSGTFDFSGATQLKHPVAAGYVSAANGELGYDSTNLNWHGWANGADEFFAGFSVSAPPTSGHLAEFSKSANSWSLVDGGAPTSGTVTSIATTSPLTGGPITASGTIACATCVTSASTLSSNNLMTGAGSQGAQTVNLTGYVFANGSSAPAASSTIPIASVGSAGLSGTSPITVASSGAIACPTCNTSSATVTSFSAPSGSWPSWLVPTVTNSTSTPSLAVASSMTLANVAAGSSPSGTFDFSGATQLKHPVAAGYVSAA